MQLSHVDLDVGPAPPRRGSDVRPQLPLEILGVSCPAILARHRYYHNIMWPLKRYKSAANAAWQRAPPEDVGADLRVLAPVPSSSADGVGAMKFDVTRSKDDS